MLYCAGTISRSLPQALQQKVDYWRLDCSVTSLHLARVSVMEPHQRSKPSALVLTPTWRYRHVVQQKCVIDIDIILSFNL